MRSAADRPRLRLLSDVEEVVPGVAGVLEEHRDRLARLPLIDHVVEHVAEQQVPGRALLDPDRTFGETESIAEQLRFRCGIDDLIEGRIEAHDRKGPFCRRLPAAQELRVRQAGAESEREQEA